MINKTLALQESEKAQRHHKLAGEPVWVLSRDRWFLETPKEDSTCVTDRTYSCFIKDEILGRKIKWHYWIEIPPMEVQ